MTQQPTTPPPARKPEAVVFDLGKVLVDFDYSIAGRRIAALSVRVEWMPDDLAEVSDKIEAWFVPESVAAAWVLDESAVIAGDFQIDAAGQMRFAVFVRPGTGPRRIGRIIQRLCEIETYRAMSMLGLGRARDLTGRLNALDPRLAALVAAMADDHKAARLDRDRLGEARLLAPAYQELKRARSGFEDASLAANTLEIELTTDFGSDALLDPTATAQGFEQTAAALAGLGVVEANLTQ